MTSKLKEPHVLLASANLLRMQKNLAPHISLRSLKSIQKAFDDNVKQLYNLGKEHFEFAEKIADFHWRQKISRLYYAAYNVRRAIVLKNDGSFNMDISDHQKIDQLPADFPNQNTYSNKLKALRDDRNLSDYGHTASPLDLLNSPDDAKQLVADFIGDAKAFLKRKGLRV